jgi:hypothetical protein
VTKAPIAQLPLFLLLRRQQDGGIVIAPYSVCSAKQEATMARAQRARSVKQETVPVKLKEVVEGIRLQVSGRELGVRLGERIRWHRERGDALIEQMKKLTDLELGAADALTGTLGRYESPRAVLEKKLHEHQERASFLTFLRDHVSPEEVYRLDSSDLRMTEILPEKAW